MDDTGLQAKHESTYRSTWSRKRPGSINLKDPAHHCVLSLAVKGGVCAWDKYLKDDEKTWPKKDVGSFLLRKRPRRTKPIVFKKEWSSLFSIFVAGRTRNYWPEVKQELTELPKDFLVLRILKNWNKWLWQAQDLHQRKSLRDSQECCGRVTDSVTCQAFFQLYFPTVLCVSSWCRRK